MSSFRAACAVAVALLGAAAPVRAIETLSLDGAFERVIATHPELALLRLARERLQADAERAAQTPPLTVVAEVENLLGSGAASGLQSAELSLSLASLLERGGKRGARIALAERELEGVALLRDGRQLDLLAEVARRYLDALAVAALAELSQADLVRRRVMVEAAASRLAAGAATESTHLAAEAARLRVEAELEQFRRREQMAKRRLAILWGGADVPIELASADLTVLPVVPDYAELQQQLAMTPALRRFAHAERIQEARLQLARSTRVADLSWQVGMRRLQADSDWALIGSVSLPLGSARRAAPAIRADEAELAAIDYEREGQQRALESTLAQAWGELDLAVASAHQIDERLLPLLLRAEAAAERAYRRGALDYLDWAQLRSDSIAAQRERLSASLAAHRALIEIQRLTGRSFTVAVSSEQETSR
jgi:cobalt-zinc-cadmium efflux system outer membrane protein